MDTVTGSRLHSSDRVRISRFKLWVGWEPCPSDYDEASATLPWLHHVVWAVRKDTMFSKEKAQGQVLWLGRGICLALSYLLILLSVSLICGNFSLKVSFMSFLRSAGFTYSITVVYNTSRGRWSLGAFRVETLRPGFTDTSVWDFRGVPRAHPRSLSSMAGYPALSHCPCLWPCPTCWCWTRPLE